MASPSTKRGTDEPREQPSGLERPICMTPNTPEQPQSGRRHGRPGIDRRVAHAEVSLVGPEEAHTCYCPTCGDGHGVIRREVLHTQRFSQSFAAALATIGAYEAIYRPSGESSDRVTGEQLAPRLNEARVHLQNEADLGEDARRILGRYVVPHVVVRTILGRMLQDYEDACREHSSALVEVSLSTLMIGRPVSRGPSGLLGDGEDICFERSSVVAIGKIRQRKCAGARLLVHLLDGQDLIVFPSRQWTEDGAWLCRQASILRARVQPNDPYAEEWRAVDPAIWRG